LFTIHAETFHWIQNDGKDVPGDFCLHGDVAVTIGGEAFRYDGTVSAAALYLLRTLTEEHHNHEDENMIPCCGHFMIASGDLQTVIVTGCTNGIDWSVLHMDGGVKLVTEAGNTTFIDTETYRKEVFAFADAVEAYYQSCLPKNLAEADNFVRDGYIAFWNEWHRRRMREGSA